MGSGFFVLRMRACEHDFTTVGGGGPLAQYSVCRGPPTAYLQQYAAPARNNTLECFAFQGDFVDVCVCRGVFVCDKLPTLAAGARSIVNLVSIFVSLGNGF